MIYVILIFLNFKGVRIRFQFYAVRFTTSELVSTMFKNFSKFTNLYFSYFTVYWFYNMQILYDNKSNKVIF